jgi:hypothetical protein
VVSFLWLARSTSGRTAQIRRVVIVDWVALLCLIVAAVLLATA